MESREFQDGFPQLELGTIRTLLQISGIFGAMYLKDGKRPCFLMVTEDTGWDRPIEAHFCGHEENAGVGPGDIPRKVTLAWHRTRGAEDGTPEEA